MSSANSSIRSPPPHRQSVKQRPAPLGSSSNPVGTPSPGWRQALKQSCLDRARKNRREAVLRSRGLSPTGTGASKVNNAGTLSFTPLKAAIAGMTSPPPKGDAKTLVEEELMAKGVSVFSTPQPGGQGSVPQYGMAKTLFAGAESSRNAMMEDKADHGYEHAISMDEVYALMRDVEEELQREEARLLQELHAMEQQQIMEQRRMEDQIADFEQHTSMQMQQQVAAAMSGIPGMGGVGIGAGATVPTVVATSVSTNDNLPCPVCNAANLIYTPANVIICPNTDNGRCNLRLDVTCEGLNMSNFRDLLCRACSEHSSTGCTGNLRFQMMAQFGMTNLMAGCDQCKASTMIV